jgi:hypothetical protein
MNYVMPAILLTAYLVLEEVVLLGIYVNVQLALQKIQLGVMIVMGTSKIIFVNLVEFFVIYVQLRFVFNVRKIAFHMELIAFVKQGIQELRCAV